MDILPYQPKHKSSCLAIFQSNWPKYFADHELKLFERWLNDYHLRDYYVVAQSGKLIACGGVYLDERYDKASLSWGMVHQQYHGEGVGRKFTEFRLQEIQRLFPNKGCMIETSQHTYKFYEKLGFQTQEITPNGFGEGLDKYYMELQ